MSRRTGAHALVRTCGSRVPTAAIADGRGASARPPTGAFTALTGNPWHRVDVDALRYVPLNLLLAIVVTAVVVALGASLPGLRARDRRRAARAASRALFAGSVIAILTVTLASSTLSSGTNLVPLRGIAGQLANLNGQVGTLNILGNAVMFLPAGLLAPMALGWGIGRVTAAACALSVAIEIVQLALGRSADVDDVILNTVGAALGAAVAVAIAIFYRRAADRRPAPSEDRQGSDCTPPALR